jgi:formylglycine-generating enzyme required for sulfatase activity
MERIKNINFCFGIYCVFSLTLLLSLSSCSSPTPPSTTTLTVTSTPDAAYIMINGTEYGQTPVTISDLALGEHYVILAKENYKRLNRRISLVADTPLKLNLVLAHDTGTVNFTTKPDGAKVYLNTEENSELIGETPLNNAIIDTGSYTFELQLENHHPLEGELVIENNNYYTEEHNLKAMVAQIQIFSQPSGAEVWLNDEKRPETTPANITLTSGEYSIGVYKQGYMIDERPLKLGPNENYKLTAILEEGNMPLGMVLVPEGEFTFGENNKSPDEKPQKKILLDAFFIDKYEVTNAQFKQVFPNYTFPERRDKFPVCGISWKQASTYAARVGKRLPTEMEWEKAARGAKGLEYPWGAAFQKSLVNFKKGLSPESKAIGSFRQGASEYGCYDMAGNVYEWVSDWYNPYPGNPEVTIDYGTVYKVLRGGSYTSDLFEVRSAKRHYDNPDAKREDYGFRCAQDITP